MHLGSSDGQSSSPSSTFSPSYEVEKKKGETAKSDDTNDGYCKPGGFGDFMPVGSVRCPSETKTERYQVQSSIRCRVPIRYRCGGRKYLLRGLPVFDISRRYHGTKVLGLILRKCSRVLWQWYVTLHAVRSDSVGS